MGRSQQTFNKSEREKNKAKKRKAKQERREQRKLEKEQKGKLNQEEQFMYRRGADRGGSGGQPQPGGRGVGGGVLRLVRGHRERGIVRIRAWDGGRDRPGSGVRGHPVDVVLVLPLGADPRRFRHFTHARAGESAVEDLP